MADDDATFRKVVLRHLRREGYEAAAVANADAALHRLTREPFDLLVADLHMPGNRGLAVLREQRRVPVLVVTGNPSLATAQLAVRGAAIDYLVKPFDGAEFLRRVAEGVALGRALRERTGWSTDDVALGRMRIPRSGTGTGTGTGTETETETESEALTLLSPREREVVTAYCRAPKLTAVAAELCISPHTAKNHLRSIYRKLGVRSGAELVRRVMREPAMDA